MNRLAHFVPAILGQSVLAALLVGVAGAASADAPPPGMAQIPAGSFRPLFAGVTDLKEVPVNSFALDILPVTNGDFLEFVRANPRWRKSQVKRIFADESYLSKWSGDLDPGSNAPVDVPVTRISWFAAKAYAEWQGKRLPSTAEWEVAAAAGFSRADGENDPEFKSQVFRWYTTPSPPELPVASASRANFWGVRALHGIAWEWVADFNVAMVTGDARNDTGLDRQLFCGAGSQGARDVGNFPAFMRYGFRSSLKAAYCVHNLGFRCAKDL
jgi:formylglycine-generating enzyme required for sulfatase activity